MELIWKSIAEKELGIANLFLCYNLERNVKYFELNERKYNMEEVDCGSHSWREIHSIKNIYEENIKT